jgi:hypothetical protein
MAAPILSSESSAPLLFRVLKAIDEIQIKISYVVFFIIIQQISVKLSISEANAKSLQGKDSISIVCFKHSQEKWSLQGQDHDNLMTGM